MSHFADWQAFWHMGGYAAHVWSAYGLVVLVLILQLTNVLKKWRRLRKNLYQKYIKLC
jgi:heme exporter protein CcmD